MNRLKNNYALYVHFHSLQYLLKKISFQLHINKSKSDEIFSTYNQFIAINLYFMFEYGGGNINYAYHLFKIL